MEAKTKSRATPAQLRQLEANRIKGMETRKMKAQLRKAELEENKKKLVEQYESKILKKSSSPTTPPPLPTPLSAKNSKIEETEDPIYEEVQSAPKEGEEEGQDENYPIEIVKPKRERIRAPPPVKQEPDYRQEYYKHKLTNLTKRQQEEQFTQQYSQLPAQAHAVDIAKATLVNKANKEMLSRVYNELFS
jgi:hypothetical protein